MYICKYNKLKRHYLMRKIFSSLTILALSTITANAQLTVYSDGNVGIATDDATLSESTLSINGGKEGYYFW